MRHDAGIIATKRPCILAATLKEPRPGGRRMDMTASLLNLFTTTNGRSGRPKNDGPGLRIFNTNLKEIESWLMN
jgi:hypothetical protein